MSSFTSGVWGGDGAGEGAAAPITVTADILYPALRLAGVLTGPQHGASASMLADAFQSLNRMLGRWNANRLLIPSIAINLYPLSAGVPVYTLGPGGDWDGPRPQRIERANLVDQANYRTPLAVLEYDRWARKRSPELPGIPRELYDDRRSPQTQIYIWPVPDETYQAELFTWRELARFTALTEAVLLPQEYLDAIVYNLAVRLAGQFQKVIRPDVAQDARQSLAEVQSLNAPSPLMDCDAAVLGTRGSFNILTGEFE